MLIHTHFARLLPLFLRERDAGRSVVLATIVRTAGSTYRKAGSQMLIASSGEYAGLLSGGCLEGDLREHANSVLSNQQSRIVQYDMRSPDDQLFGLGAGCEGAMDILLQAVSIDNHWQPLAALHQCWTDNRPCKLGLVINEQPHWPMGGVLLSTGEFITPANDHTPPANELLAAQHELLASRDNSVHTLENSTQLFILYSTPAPRLLILGAGPDAQPLATLTDFLGWKATIYDHRSAYANRAKFPNAEQVITARPEQLQEYLRLDDYHAIVIMSHHLDADLQYLQQVATCQAGYIGLLGPAARRERLFGNLGAQFNEFRTRLHAPVGMQIGASTPEAIALAIISEVHAALARVQ
jgi:xanthine/CO dehydrogenase XdhC/CoxF family maturation factor